MDRPSSSQGSRRLTWMVPFYGGKSSDKDKDAKDSVTSPSACPEGPPSSEKREPFSQTSLSTRVPSGGGLPFARSSSSSTLSGTPYPSTYNANRQPLSSRRSSTNSVLTKQQLDQEASQIIMNALSRSNSRTSDSGAPSPPPPPPASSSRYSGAFSRKSFSSMMGGLSALSLSRSSTNDDKERGRSRTKDEGQPRSASVMSEKSGDETDMNIFARARSTSPFHRRRSKKRDGSPSVEALKLSQSDVESDFEGRAIRPRNNAFSTDDDSADDDDDDDESDNSWDDDDVLDPITEQNTEKNAIVAIPHENDVLDGPDPLGEGVNIVVPPEPYFPSTLNSDSRRGNPKRKKSIRHVSLPSVTSRPTFLRDRCIITLIQGDPVRALEESGRRARRYVVASDLSEESRYAVEWGIGTVLRDGDELVLVSVNENEAKVDPQQPNQADRVSKLRNQQERQTLAYILVRQVIGLLQRTKLNVTVSCQAWHAKNARHMLLDIVDHLEPTMLIVGSRGLGQLKGILLGSTSHYLVQKCSVPVMVARRRLKRPARRSAHLSPHRARVSLAEAAKVERVTPKVDREVENMRDEMERDEERRENEDVIEAEAEDEETEHEGDTTVVQIGEKVAGD